MPPNTIQNQCRRYLNKQRCLRTHIQGHYMCIECIEDVEERKRHSVLRCRRELPNEKKCDNEKVKGKNRCQECIDYQEQKVRYYPSKWNRDLIIDLKL